MNYLKIFGFCITNLFSYSDRTSITTSKDTESIIATVIKIAIKILDIIPNATYTNLKIYIKL